MHIMQFKSFIHKIIIIRPFLEELRDFCTGSCASCLQTFNILTFLIFIYFVCVHIFTRPQTKDFNWARKCQYKIILHKQMLLPFLSMSTIQKQSDFFTTIYDRDNNMIKFLRVMPDLLFNTFFSHDYFIKIYCILFYNNNIYITLKKNIYITFLIIFCCRKW